MGIFLKIVAAAAVLLMAPLPAQARDAAMLTGGRTTQPVGHYDFCMRHIEECNQRSARGLAPAELTRKLWTTLIEVNNAVNTSVTPMTDKEIWGVEEHWSYPVNGVGDCEDYVLEKRRLLMKAGIAPGNLLITVVRQRNGDGHAVLTVRTNLGDFVLDNLEPLILAWNDTSYRYLKRQSEQHSGIWLSIENDRNLAVGSVR